jgi:hypothetical protein
VQRKHNSYGTILPQVITYVANHVVWLLGWCPWLQDWAAWVLDGVLVRLGQRSSYDQLG